MNIVRKIYRRMWMMVSQAVIPKGSHAIRHVHLKDFEMLVLANEDVGRLIAIFRDFEPEESKFFQGILKPDDICFDVGGNVGYFSMLMAERARQGSVHVFEPIPLNAAMVRTNAELNDFPHIIVNNVAVGDEAGTANFSISVDSAYSSMKATGRKAEEKSIKVPIWTLDEYIENNAIPRVDIMKVDVEGAEDMVVKGASRLLSDASRRPRIILLELFDLNLQPFGVTVSEIVGRMVDFGYAANVINSHGALSPYKPDMANTFPNIIFTS